MSGKRRLFAGIALDAKARDACAAIARRVRDAGLDARFDDPQKYHLTLAFLGNVEAPRVAGVEAALAAAAETCAPFVFDLDKIGAFPHERKPRIAYVGSRDAGPYRSLAGAVRLRLRELGFTFPEDAVAHVTIARSASPARVLPQVDVVPFPLNVREIALFESLYDAAARTSRYEIVALRPLGQAGSGPA